MPTADGKPKVFISYCWDNAETVRRVNAFADYLDANFVHLEMDRYLPDGANLYRFMETMVTDPGIDKVMCFVDNAYMKKAHGGQGGVGTETTIISPDVYRQAAKGDPEHVKFVPILMEKPLDPDHPLPPMFGTAKYVYMADPDSDVANMMQLLNLCFGRPAYTRSTTAIALAHLRAGGATFDPTVSGLGVAVRTLVKQEKARLALASFEDFLESIIRVIEGFDGDSLPSYRTNRLSALAVAFAQRVDLMGAYTHVIEDLLRYTEDTLAIPLHSFFLQLMRFSFGSAERGPRDLSRLLSRELFVITVAVYLRRHRYQGLHHFLNHKYRLRDNSWRTYECLSYGPEDLSDNEDWLRIQSTAAWTAAGVSPLEAGQAELILMIWGAVTDQNDSFTEWSYTNTDIWERSDFRPSLFWDIHSEVSAAPLTQIFNLPLVRIFGSLQRVKRESFNSRVSIQFILDAERLSQLPYTWFRE